MPSIDSFDCRREMTVGGKTYIYFDLKEAEKNGLDGISRLPYTLKVLLENLLRREDGKVVTKEMIAAVKGWMEERSSTTEIAYQPARILLQDFTGVPAVVDLAAMRDAAKELGADPDAINPQAQVDLVIDHSVMVDYFGNPTAFKKNVEREYERNLERYKFLKWGASAFKNFRVVPPGTGICHQVNLEYLGQTVWTKEEDGVEYAMPDTLVGTDSHTTMINGLSVLGWGVGGIEAEAAMLGQPISMLIPEVAGFKLTGKLKEGVTATDLVLTVTDMLRKHGVVGKFVEFFGEGLDTMSIEDEATISNMSPEYGATCGFFPTDDDTLRYLKATGRDPQRIALVEAYAKGQGLWRPEQEEPLYSSTLELDLGEVVASIAGPKRPQDRIELTGASDAFAKALADTFNKADDAHKRVKIDGEDYSIGHGDVTIAAITSCTNTSNPSGMIGAGLLARNALEKGLEVKPWVKTSLAPGSQVVTDYLERANLQDDPDALGFNLAGYGCTTCIGNSGPLPEPISAAVKDGDLVAASVLSGNRNFEGRISPEVKANYLASPPLVVAYALAGSMNVDLTEDPVGYDGENEPVYLADIWPDNAEIADLVRSAINPQMFAERYGEVFEGDEQWRGIEVTGGQTYDWDDESTYVRNPPYFEGMSKTPEPKTNVKGANILALLGDSITTDHISPAGSIWKESPAGQYLIEHGVEPREFNSYGSRRGNHEVMMRGTFANIRIRNQMTPDKEGGYTKHVPSGETMPIYDAAMKYLEDGTDLVVFAGKEYGTGSSRDWAAKGTILLGVKAVIAESYERIHRSNLIGMGVLPLQFVDAAWDDLGLTGEETVDVPGVEGLTPGAEFDIVIHMTDGTEKTAMVRARIDTENELEYYKNGGILHYVLRNLAA